MKTMCGNCGSKNIARKSIKGRFFTFKSFARLKADDNLELATCQECGNIILAAGEAKLLDQALDRSITLSTERFIHTIMKKTTWLQSELADYVGISPVYISEIKTGKKIPEFKTFSYLRLLSDCAGAIEMLIENDPRCTIGHFDVKIVHQFQQSATPLEPQKVNDEQSGESAAEDESYGIAA